MNNKYQETASVLSSPSLFVLMKTSYKFMMASISLRVFGNSLGIKVNFLYFCQQLSSKFLSNNSDITLAQATSKQKAQELAQNGFTKLGPFYTQELSDFIFREFQNTPIQNSTAYLSKNKVTGLSKPLFQLLSGEIQSVLFSYYGSYAQPYWTNIMRYVEGDRMPDSSFGYHIDDNPKQLLKIFIYLNDTYKDNGAFRTFDYTVSKNLIRKGFISLTPELRIQSQKLIDKEMEMKNLNILEGEKGTVLLFDNNLVHKGTLPEKGFRDVICVEVYPSSRKWTEEDIAVSLQSPIMHDYPPNPFYNDILQSKNQR